MTWNGVAAKTWKALNATLFELAGTPISMATVVTVVLIIALTLLTSRIVQRASRQAFRFRGVDHEGTVRAVSRLLHYVTLLVGFGIAMQTIGIDLGALFAAGAIFAVGLGFAMQSIAQNFVAGVILLVEQSIKPGDIVEVEGGIVRIQEMGIRATIVETRDGEQMIVPNSALIQSTVKNYTLGNTEYRLRVPVGVVYSADMNQVFDTLKTVATEVSRKWGARREPMVVMTGFGNNSVNFEMGVWMRRPWDWKPALSELHEAVWWAFKAHNIVIAFPQLDVHLDPSVVGAIKKTG